MAENEKCIFCDIVAGQAPSSKVFEDEHAVAFMDIFPAARGHLLVVSKTHAESLMEVDEETCVAVARTVRKLAAALDELLAPDGISVVQANGEAAGQTVMHYHVHLLPRTAGVKLRLHGPRQANQNELSELAAQISALL